MTAGPEAGRRPVAAEPAGYRAAMARLATGVTVVTTTTPAGPVGMTASAVCSLSLEPVQLLVCVAQALPTHRALGASPAFAVNVLGEGQEGLAERFATPGIDRFAGVGLRGDQDLPVLAEALAWFVCRTEDRLPGGDHSIFIGRVEACGHDEAGGRPLVYFGRDFATLETPEAARWRSFVEAGAVV